MKPVDPPECPHCSSTKPEKLQGGKWLCVVCAKEFKAGQI